MDPQSRSSLSISISWLKPLQGHSRSLKTLQMTMKSGNRFGGRPIKLIHHVIGIFSRPSSKILVNVNKRILASFHRRRTRCHTNESFYFSLWRHEEMSSCHWRRKCPGPRFCPRSLPWGWGWWRWTGSRWSVSRPSSTGSGILWLCSPAKQPLKHHQPINIFGRESTQFGSNCHIY